MYSEFAYSAQMQFILAVIAFISTFVFMYLIGGLIVWVYGNEVNPRQKVLFAFITGTLMQSVMIYAIYFIRNRAPFSDRLYLLVTTPNPIFALIYCYIGIKVLKLSKVRSIKTMGKFYLYYLFVRSLYRLIGFLCLGKTGAIYNYLQDAILQSICLAATFAIYYITRRVLRDLKPKLSVGDNVFVNQREEIIRYILVTTIGWLAYILIPTFIPQSLMASVLLPIFLLMFWVMNILQDYILALELYVDNSDTHIHALTTGITRFSGIKHDFYNILQTYGGYLEIGDLEKLRAYHVSLVQTTTNAGSSIELSRRLSENPAFISLLIGKLAYAEMNSVQFKTSLQGAIDDFYINNMDLCRVVACLLDNAVEGAKESERKTVLMTVTEKSPQAKLVVISNSTAVMTDMQTVMNPGHSNKEGHSGMGLSNVRDVVHKYGNCTFRLSCCNDEFTAYLEIRQRPTPLREREGGPEGKALRQGS